MAGGAKNQKLDERMTMLEKAFEKIIEKMSVMEQTLEQRMTECEKGMKMSGDSSQELKTFNQDLSSRVTVCEMTTGERLSKIEGQIKEIEDKMLALGLRLQEFKTEFPTPAETRSASQSDVTELPADNSRSSGSCSEMLKTTRKSVLLIGDSLARGVGDKLSTQCGRAFVTKSTGGAKIESIRDQISKLDVDAKRHLVIIAGTNNLENDYSDEILTEYDKLIEISKEKSKKVTVVGIVKRFDLHLIFETKRIFINMKLKKMCATKKVAFVEYDPESRQLEKDQLHLNKEGQEELAGKIFRNCVPFYGKKMHF